jgi:mono/diheme cytochrome c family protein
MKFKLIVALTFVVLMAGCAVSTPGRMETNVMTGVKHRLTVRGKNDRNPMTASADVINAGRRNFGYYCFSCHGLDGQNTGVPFADRMSPPVPALTSPQVQSYTDGQLKWIIEHGISPSGMPASQGILSDEEIWAIVQYVRHLPAKGSLGEPPAYSGK